jgi:hypothetical protein
MGRRVYIGIATCPKFNSMSATCTLMLVCLFALRQMVTSRVVQRLKLLAI